MNNNFSKFSYPVKYDSGWHYEKASNILGGRKSWFFRKWKSKGKTSFWSGIVILGFKRIKVIYTCSEEEARIEFKKGHERLVKFLKDLIDGKIKEV